MWRDLWPRHDSGSGSGSDGCAGNTWGAEHWRSVWTWTQRCLSDVVWGWWCHDVTSVWPPQAAGIGRSNRLLLLGLAVYHMWSWRRRSQRTPADRWEPISFSLTEQWLKLTILLKLWHKLFTTYSDMFHHFSLIYVFTELFLFSLNHFERFIRMKVVYKLNMNGLNRKNKLSANIVRLSRKMFETLRKLSLTHI